MNIDKTKSCTKCGNQKPITEFYKRKNGMNGLSPCCKICESIYQKKWRKNNPELVKKTILKHKDNQSRIGKVWYEKNKDKKNKQSRMWSLENKDRHKKMIREWLLKNRHTQKNWARENPEKNAAKAARRRAVKKNATPLWANNSAIDNIYLKSKELTIESGVTHNVDHVVPLVSGIVCGLHCQDNLRIITQFDNYSKNNRWWPDMWSAEQC